MAEQELEKVFRKLAIQSLQELKVEHAPKDAADVDKNLFFGAIQMGNNRAVHGFLLKDVDPNSTDEHGRSGLHMSALGGHQDIFSALLNRNANPELSDENGITPLMCACQKGSEVIVDLLLAKDVDVTKTTTDGLSAVFYALYNRHVSIAEKLERKKSCIHDLKEESTLSIYMKAVTKNWTDVVKFMYEHKCEITHSNKQQIASQAGLCGHTEMLQYFPVNFAEKTSDGRSPLRCAVQNGFIDAVRYMLDHGCDVTGNEECVQAAVISNHLDILKLLLDKGAPMFKPDEDGITPVQLAIVQGSFEMFQYLVEKGCSLEPHKEMGSLALIAASKRKVEVLRYLAERQMTINEPDQDTGETPLLAACQGGPLEAVELLLDNGCDPSAVNRRGVSPALRAAHNNQEEILMMLGERGANLDIPNRHGETAILCAARNKSFSMVQYLARKGCKLDTKDVNGRTVAFYAVKGNNVALLRFLQQRNVSLDDPDVNGVTPLMTAVNKGALDTIKQLTSMPNLCNIKHHDCKGRTVMHIAVSAGKMEIVKLLHEKGADLNASDHEGNTPLLECLKRRKACDILLYLIKNGCDLQGTNDKLRNATHYACKQQENDAMMLLLDAECPVDTQDRLGMTPFMVSSEKGSESFVTILKAVGADVNRRNMRGENAVHLAAKIGNLKIVQIFSLFGCSLDQEDKTGITPLIIACFKNKPEMVDFLIRKGADVNTVTHKGETPVHFACHSGSLDVVKILHKNGALLDQPDVNGVTPVLLAAAKQNEEFLTFMCNNGCDVTRVDKALKTALHYAVLGKNEPVIRFLIDKGLDPNSLDDSGTSPVLLSIKLNVTSILSLLTSKGGMVNEIFDSESRNAAHFACQVGNEKLLRELRGKVSFSSRTADGENCLTITCANGHEKVVKVLLEQSTNVNFKNAAGDNALHIAAKKSHLSLIPLLLANGIRVMEKDAEGNNVLHILCGKICTSKLDKVEVLKTETHQQLDTLKAAVNKTTGPKQLRTGFLKMIEETKALPDRLLKQKLLPNCVAKKALLEQLTSLLEKVSVTEVNKAGKSALHFACTDGSKHVISLLLSEGADVNLADADGETPIFTAVRQGKEKAVALLVSKEADLTVTNKNGLSPLAVAVAENNDRIMKILMNSGAQFDPTAAFKHLALKTLFKRHNLDHLDFLISRGFDGKKLYNGKTLLHHAVLTGDARLLKALTAQKYAFVREILDHQDSDGDTAFHLAVMRGRLDMAEVLIQIGCKVDLKNKKGHTVLHVAAIDNKLSLVKWLSEKCAEIFQSDAVDQEGTPSPLHLAAIKGNLDVFKFLEEKGFSADRKCSDGNNCAHYAAIYGNLHILMHLQSHEGSVALFAERNVSDFTPLQCAVLNGHEKIADFLYKKDSSLPSCIVHQAVQLGNQHMVDWVQKRGADMGAVEPDGDGDSSTMLAVLSGNFHLVKGFLDAVADPCGRNRHGNTLASAAGVKGHRHILQFLKDKSAPLDEPDSDGDTAICDCAIQGHLESMKLLQEFGCNLRHKNARQRSIVHLACIGPEGKDMKGHLNIVKFAQDQQIPLDDADVQGNTGLMYACRQGFKDIADFLLIGKHSDPNKANASGSTAAHLAVMAGRSDILDVLSQHGARLDAEDGDGTTPLMIAVHRNSLDCVTLLMDKVGLGDDNRSNRHGWTVQRLAASASDEVRREMERRGVELSPDIGDRPQEVGLDIDIKLCVHGHRDGREQRRMPHSRHGDRQGPSCQNAAILLETGTDAREQSEEDNATCTEIHELVETSRIQRGGDSDHDEGSADESDDPGEETRNQGQVEELDSRVELPQVCQQQ